MAITASEYQNRMTRCSITPTFRYVKHYIVGKVLDIGIGTGEYLEKFPEGSVGVDVSEVNMRIAREKGLNVFLADANEKLPFKESEFQTVFCSHVIEHVDSPINLLRETKRVLAEEGILILAIPTEKTLIAPFTEGYFKGHRGHLYGLSVENIDCLLEKTGFQTIERYYNLPIINRILFIDRIFQLINGDYSQYISTMYWVVARKIK